MLRIEYTKQEFNRVVSENSNQALILAQQFLVVTQAAIARNHLLDHAQPTIEHVAASPGR